MNYTQREKFVDRLCGASLMLIFIEVIYAIVDYAYMSSFNYNNVTIWTYISGGVLAILGVALLINAYLKKNTNKAFYGAELLAMAISIALLPGCYLFFSASIAKIKNAFPFVFLIYYIGKALYIIKHRNDNVKKK